VARIVSAGIEVVAIRGLSAGNADAVNALVPSGARVSVVAGCGGIGVDTSGRRLAFVVGAGVPVVALQDVGSRRALTSVAQVPNRAQVPIIARGFGVLVLASLNRVAQIVGALVAVAAIQLPFARDTRSVHATVSQRAHVIITARQVVGLEHTAAGFFRVARVGGTQIAVVATLELPHTGTVGAGVGFRALVVVRTGRLVKRIVASRKGPTYIIGTLVAVIAVHGLGARLALSVLAIVVLSTIIAIVTIEVVGRELAAVYRVAGIGGAGVAVVTDQRFEAGHALPVLALVAFRARIAVVTSGAAGLVEAAGFGRARIDGASIAVVTIGLIGARLALSVGACIAQGTHVAIIALAFKRVVDASIHRVTGVFRARVAITAIDILPDTLALRADIALSTLVSIVTKVGGILIVASRGRVTCILGAQISVITLQFLIPGYADPV